MSPIEVGTVSIAPEVAFNAPLATTAAGGIGIGAGIALGAGIIVAGAALVAYLR
ncbi:hypothetical protein [Salinigranum sp.]|uniref:hypothetical protein n=1 Tax=Salinigranum sp. TaxID=1966351 RepID=UPI003562C268